MNTLKSILGPSDELTVQQIAWLAVYGVFCFGAAGVAMAIALAPLFG